MPLRGGILPHLSCLPTSPLPPSSSPPTNLSLWAKAKWITVAKSLEVTSSNWWMKSYLGEEWLKTHMPQSQCSEPWNSLFFVWFVRQSGKSKYHGCAIPFPSGRNHPEEKVHCPGKLCREVFKKLLWNLKEPKKKNNNIEEARRRQKDSNYDTLGKNSPLGISLLFLWHCNKERATQGLVGWGQKYYSQRVGLSELKQFCS